MSIVSEAFRRLEEERAVPQAELRVCSIMRNPLDRPRRHIHVLVSGTVRAAEEALRNLCASNRWPEPRRIRGVLRIDIEISMTHERWGYYVKVLGK
jgi:hypothetical protein